MHLLVQGQAKTHAFIIINNVIAMRCFTKYYLYFSTDKSYQTESEGISQSSSILGKLFLSSYL